MLSKPDGCKLCRLSYLSSGFVPDKVSADPKLALVYDLPRNSDLLEQGYWGGSRGAEREAQYLKPLGLTRKDILISSALRCGPPKDWPTGAMGTVAVKNCRQYDGALIEYKPDIALATFGLDDVATTPALYRLVMGTLEKAMRFQKRGYRPIVLAGTHAIKLVFPWMPGVKRWHGHYEELANGWPHKEELCQISASTNTST